MCLPEVDDDHWLSNLEASGWLKHIKMVIAGAAKIVDKVNFFSTVTEALCQLKGELNIDHEYFMGDFY